MQDFAQERTVQELVGGTPAGNELNGTDDRKKISMLA